VLICVRDNGIGVPTTHQQTIFRVFERLNGGERPGTGMGLAICRRIVERHGGRIWLESEPGRGAASTSRWSARASEQIDPDGDSRGMIRRSLFWRIPP